MYIDWEAAEGVLLHMGPAWVALLLREDEVMAVLQLGVSEPDCAVLLPVDLLDH